MDDSGGGQASEEGGRMNNPYLQFSRLMLNGKQTSESEIERTNEGENLKERKNG